MQEVTVESLADFRKEFLMFYNVENLFPPDPVERKKFNPKVSGLRNWNEKRYDNKLHKLARVFQLFKQEHRVLPLLVGVSEVQGARPLEDLLKLPVFENKYSFVHFESMDERGVDVALLYDHTKVKLEDAEPLVYFFAIEDDDPENYDTTRDVLSCRMAIGNETVEIYVLHLPSKRSDEVNQPKRKYILSELKDRIEKQKEKGARVLVLGDFNEDPINELLLDFTKSKSGEELLFNPFEDVLLKRKFSTFHKREGLLFDQILLSPSFLQRRENRLTFDDAGVFNHPQIANFERKDRHRPFRTYSGSRYLGGYSDHFPVYISLEI